MKNKLHGNIGPAEETTRLSVEIDCKTGVFYVTNGAWEGTLRDFDPARSGPYVLEITDESAPNRGALIPNVYFTTSNRSVTS